MANKFFQCTPVNGKGQALYVNSDYVTQIIPNAAGCTVMLSDGKGYEVTEAVQHLLLQITDL